MSESSNKQDSDPAAQVIDLPMEGSEYFQILGVKNAVKMRAGLVTLKPREEVGSHNTENYEELIIVLEGRGEIESDRSPGREIAVGKAAYNPPHSQHNVRNIGSGPLRYIYVVSKS